MLGDGVPGLDELITRRDDHETRLTAHAQAANPAEAATAISVAPSARRL